MSKYFQPITIEKNKPEAVPEPVNTDLIPDVSSAFPAIDQIIAELQAGTSPLRSTALYFPEGKSSPVKETLKRLKSNPTSKKALREFIVIAQADLTRRVALAFVDHLKFADPTLGDVLK